MRGEQYRGAIGNWMVADHQLSHCNRRVVPCVKLSAIVRARMSMNGSIKGGKAMIRVLKRSNEYQCNDNVS